jgi:endonuclease/exonuclease/phosphatase family metal-dependent hydrolase
MLAEVENLSILDDLNKKQLGNAYFDLKLIEGNDPRGINVAVMSKIPLDDVKSHKDDFFTKIGTNGPTYKYSRDCLEVHLTYNNRKIILLAVHFRAKAPPDDPDKRLAEAQHTRAIADELAKADPTAGIIVLGDYNDTPGSDPVNAIAGMPPSVFTDAADQVAQADRYSFNFQGTHELIDHQFANPVMAPMLDPKSVVLKHGKGIDDDSQGASDHAPLFAIYQVR